MQKTVVRLAWIPVFFILSLSAYSQSLFNFQSISDPLGTTTYAYGVSGNEVVGSYADSMGGMHGYLYDGNAYTTIDVAGATKTYANALAGNRVIGNYLDGSGLSHGFTYNTFPQTTGFIDYPTNDPFGIQNTYLYGQSGNTTVGTFQDSTGTYGFTFADTYTRLTSIPGNNSPATGISGSNIIGSYPSGSGKYGYIYNTGSSNLVTLDYREGAHPYINVAQTSLTAISGNLVLGSFLNLNNYSSYNFLYNGVSYFSLQNNVNFSGISADANGVRVVGNYKDGSGGFIAQLALAAAPATPVTPASNTNTVHTGEGFTNAPAFQSTGGFGNTISLVGGTSSGNKQVVIASQNGGPGFSTLASDSFSVTGNDGDVFALQLSFDAAAAAQLGGASNVVLLYKPPGSNIYENAVDGDHGVNTTNSLYFHYQGSFASFESQYGINDANLFNYLGAYGVDTNNDVAWAVIDHNSDFGAGIISAVPEPSFYALFGLGAFFLLIAVKRKSA